MQSSVKWLSSLIWSRPPRRVTASSPPAQLAEWFQRHQPHHCPGQAQDLVIERDILVWPCHRVWSTCNQRTVVVDPVSWGLLLDGWCHAKLIVPVGAINGRLCFVKSSSSILVGISIQPWLPHLLLTLLDSIEVLLTTRDRGKKFNLIRLRNSLSSCLDNMQQVSLMQSTSSSLEQAQRALRQQLIASLSDSLPDHHSDYSVAELIELVQLKLADLAEIEDATSQQLASPQDAPDLDRLERELEQMMVSAPSVSSEHPVHVEVFQPPSTDQKDVIVL